MTMIDDSAAKAVDFMKAAENVVQSYNILSNDHAAQLARDFPTLTSALAILRRSYSSLGISPNVTTPPASSPPTR